MERPSLSSALYMRIWLVDRRLAWIGMTDYAADAFAQPYDTNSSIPLTNCADGSLCCGRLNGSLSPFEDGTANCCKQRSGFLIVDGKVSTGTPSASVARMTTIVIATSTTSISTTSSATVTFPTPIQAPSARTTDTGAVIGGVVGGVVAVLFIGLAFEYFVVHRKLKSNIRSGPPAQSLYDFGEQEGWQIPRKAPVDSFRSRDLEAQATRTQLGTRSRWTSQSWKAL